MAFFVLRMGSGQLRPLVSSVLSAMFRGHPDDRLAGGGLALPARAPERRAGQYSTLPPPRRAPGGPEAAPTSSDCGRNGGRPGPSRSCVLIAADATIRPTR